MTKDLLKSLRYLLIVSVITIGFISIIASNGGDNGEPTPTGNGGGDYTGSGTYDYDSTAQTLELDFGPNNFPSACEIEDVTVSDVIIGETSLEWSMGSDAFTWTRSSGTAGDIVGEWTLENEPLVLTFNSDNTFTLVGTNFSCGSGDSGSDSPSKNASGTYEYDSEAETLSTNTTFSDFDCGPEVGTRLQNVTELSGTTLTIQDEDIEMTYTRDSGNSEDIVGVWNYSDGSEINLTCTFNSDGTFSVSGTIDCPSATFRPKYG